MMNKPTPPPSAVRRVLEADGAPDLLIRPFERSVESIRSGARGFIAEADIEPVATLPRLEEWEGYRDAGQQALAHTVFLKLNGGLGTGMGLDRAKSLLIVKEGRSFLEIIIRQTLYLRARHQSSIPLLFMNSFSTDVDTQEVLAQFPSLIEGQAGLPFRFLQHRVPKLLQATLEPARHETDDRFNWCPPGHGDLYVCLQTSGILEQLLQKGYRYLFVSNADNLGATLDLGILGAMAEQHIPFLMECTARTAADSKGGHLARARGGSLLLRESAQCPPEEVPFFQDIERHRYFNTNNLWIHLEKLQAHLAQHDGIVELPVMVNRKTLDPTDPASPPVYQLETAMGAALSQFSDAVALEVPRTRFAPVKTTNDLLVLRSDAYHVDEANQVTLAPQRKGRVPWVRLDPAFYKLLPDFDARFPQGAPSLVACDALKVTGDVTFGKQVVVQGNVTVHAPAGEPLVIPDHTVLTP